MLKRVTSICCIGAGYVGGPTMAVIADLSQLPVYEPGLTGDLGIHMACSQHLKELSFKVKQS